VTGGLVLGVDGGGTKTIAVVAAADGSVKGRARGANTSIYDHPDPATALAELEAVVSRALADAGAGVADLRAATFCLAGADWPEDVALLERALDAMLPGRPFEVLHDSLAHLWAGHPDGVGVAVAFGTGLAVGAGNADGRTFSSANWLDPSGSHGLGEDAIRAVFDAHLGVGPRTTLVDALLAATGTGSTEALAHVLTGRCVPGRSRVRAADLGPLVLDSEAAGDPVAARIVRARVHRMAEFVHAAAARVGLAAPYPVALGGGPTRHPGRALLTGLRRALGAEATVTLSRREPALGSVVKALRDGGPLTPAVLDRLDATAPAADYYATLERPGQGGVRDGGRVLAEEAQHHRL
jgi:N-acetylglucosamine kinase-like BadF-type ATPase